MMNKRHSDDINSVSSKRVVKKKKHSALNADDLNDQTIFGKVVKKAGLNLKAGTRPHEIRVGQVNFQRNILNVLERNDNYPQVIAEFLEAFQEHITDSSRLKSSLMPTVTAIECDASASGGRQECLIRLLLGVDCLQSKLMSILLEKLMDIADEPSQIGQSINLPQLMLNQFRWLDHVVDSKACLDKMFDMICVTSVEVQKEIIGCIPELVDDESHGEIARKLRDLLITDGELTVPILDALTNLNLKADLLTEVRSSVIGNMASMDVEDLPAVVKFLLQSIGSQDAAEVIKDMRGKLDFSTTSMETVTQQNRMSESSKRGCEALTLDAIKMEVLFRKSVADAWIKVIQDVRTASDHCVVDVFVLLILYNNAQSKRKNAVESLFRNKIRAGHFTENLLQTAFRSYRKILRDCFNSILTLAEVLLRSPEPVICFFAMSMYKQAVINFDTACQQEVIANLVTHIGSGVEGEVDSSLDILGFLAEKHFKLLSPFAIFIKGVLDHLDNLSMGQIRKLYSTLSILGFSSQDEGTLIQDDMHIIVRKQLSNNTLKYKRMGVIGAIMMVKCLGRDRNGKLPDDIFRQVVNLLNLVNTSCTKFPEALCLFIDELSNLIQRNCIHQRIENWVNDNVIKDFEDDVVVDYTPDVDLGTNILPMEILYNLDDDSEGGIAVNILPIAVNYLSKSKVDKAKNSRVISPLCIVPQYRLLKVCTSQAHEGDLEEISATLGCPLILPAHHLYDKLESLSRQEKELICATLFYAHNWFIEAINSFAEVTDADLRAKVISRLHNIIEVRKLLQKALAVTPNFKPPPACFDVSDDVQPPLTGGTSQGKKVGRGKKRKSGKENKGDDSIVATQLDKTMDTQIQDKSVLETQQKPTDKASSSACTVDLTLYYKYFRELDMGVFKILRSGAISKSSLNDKDMTTHRVQPAELEFLLRDLTRKLEHSLIASVCKRRSFLKTKADKNAGFSLLNLHTPQRVAELAVKLLPTICDHIEGASAFFQTLMAENDGIMDGPGSHSIEAIQIGNCLCLLLESLTIILSWNGLVMPENTSLLKDALLAISSRTTTDNISQLPMQSMVMQTFKYIEGFSTSLPTLMSAVSTCKLLVVVAKKARIQQLNSQIGALAKSFLHQEWMGADGEREKGSQCNENLQTLLKLFLTYSEDNLAALENLAVVAMPEILEGDRNTSSTTYPTLNRSTYPVFYRSMLTELVNCVRSLDPVKLTDRIQVKMQYVVKWNLAVRIFQILVNLIKAFDARSNLNSLLKSGRLFLEIFMRHGMPVLDNVFRTHREDVQSLLKNLQSSTRALHHICGHSKIMKDVTLTNQVPPVKKCLEMFVCRVKQMLTVNKCLEAFWLGNLKNRDLKGEEIVSQSTMATNGGQDDTSNDIPEALLDDDSESEVEMDAEEEKDNSGSGSDESYSETY